MKVLHVFMAAVMLLAVAGEAWAETQMEIYQETNTIIFVIDGQAAMILDKEGLHVREGVSLGGSIQDAGSQSFDDRLAKIGEEQNRLRAGKEGRHAE